MAKNAGVWGIDIGQCAFKAMRCQLEDGAVVADAFDYIEYPKILSQPEAEPEKMIQDALDQFLSRNDLKGYRVAISVPGQSGLAKFFKPPPVDAKKIPEIVKYEARQQIPFALEDVIWDFQQMGGGAEVDGFALETEVGLFAMKREQVYRAMQPFQDVGVELDFIQLAPLCIYNFISYDVLQDGMSPDDYDPDNPPPSLVVLSMGTDTTDLVITNGFRVWQRSIPLGGNHFTKQLTKELKLTFAKAEHLKRNARQAEDPKMVFKAMRPVFGDLVTEVQRSIGYFQGIDRKAKIGGVVVLGNAVKLPGLQQYLAKNLGYEVNNFQTFSRLKGPAVLGAPAFKDNLLSFGVSYGLCLQGLNQSTLRTNLVPREILTDRLVRAKKPWAVATVGALLLACTFNFFFYYGSWYQASEEREVAGVSWKAASSAMAGAKQTSSSFEAADQKLVGELDRISAIGEELVGNADRRILWLELLKSINEALPRTPNLSPGEIPDVEELPFDKREEIHVEKLDLQFFEDLTTWFTEPVKDEFVKQGNQSTAGPTAKDATATTASTTTSTGAGPKGKGWVIQLDCYHFFNSDRSKQGIAHVLSKFISKLKSEDDWSVTFPVPVTKLVPGVKIRHQVQPDRYMHLRLVGITPVRQVNPESSAEELVGFDLQLAGVQEPLRVPATGQVGVAFTPKEMGIDYPVIVQSSPIDRNFQVPNPNYEPPDRGVAGGLAGSSAGGSRGSVSAAGGGGASLADPGGSSGGSMAPGGASKAGSDEPLEPQFLVVPRYQFVVQFVWQEKQLTERLEQQAKDWETEKGRQGTQATGDANLAANVSKGGA